jgi:hypothetical protein
VDGEKILIEGLYLDEKCMHNLVLISDWMKPLGIDIHRKTILNLVFEIQYKK